MWGALASSRFPAAFSGAADAAENVHTCSSNRPLSGAAFNKLGLFLRKFNPFCDLRSVNAN